MKKDHIITPRATLKRFDDEKQSLHILDLNDLSNPALKLGRSKSFHTQLGYYDDSVDDRVKIIETDIGTWNKEISEAISKNDYSNIDYIKLKQFCIKLITLQFNRTVMENDNDRSRVLRNNKCDPTIIENREQAILMFQKRFLLQPNQVIINSYQDFVPVILYIKHDCDYSFILPPSHFIGTDSVARIIISPYISIGLYPSRDNPPSVKLVKKSEALSLIPRSFESAMEMPDNYKELIGLATDLEKIKKNLLATNKMVECNENDGIIIVKRNNEFLLTDNSVFEFFMYLYYSFSAYKKIIISADAFENLKEIHRIDWSFISSYDYEVALICAKPIKNLKYNINIFKSKNKAIEYFIKHK